MFCINAKLLLNGITLIMIIHNIENNIDSILNNLINIIMIIATFIII